MAFISRFCDYNVIINICTYVCMYMNRIVFNKCNNIMSTDMSYIECSTYKKIYLILPFKILTITLAASAVVGIQVQLPESANWAFDMRNLKLININK